MTITLITLGILCAIGGIVGCILPVIPGPALSFVSLIILSYAKNWQAFSTAFLVTMGVLTLLLSILDYAVPVFGAKKFGASKFGVWGSIIGMLVGFVFFPPLGIFIGAFFGALAGELFAGKDSKKALRAGWGSFIGNIAAIGIKLAFAGIVAFFYIKALF
ncbi:MAG: DUF456 domain-containing protein [Thermodesulfobacteriota bacterium]|nr:DUF456 domain-containing protein [Thermodesulfobacteriota bacterium]